MPPGQIAHVHAPNTFRPLSINDRKWYGQGGGSFRDQGARQSYSRSPCANNRSVLPPPFLHDRYLPDIGWFPFLVDAGVFDSWVA